MKHPKKERKLWFRAKEYGWGWYPVSWEGWMVTAVFAAAYTVSFIAFLGWMAAAKQAAGLGPTNLFWGIAEFFLWIAFLTYSLFHVCTRMGERPRWRWGKK